MSGSICCSQNESHRILLECSVEVQRLMSHDEFELTKLSAEIPLQVCSEPSEGNLFDCVHLYIKLRRLRDFFFLCPSGSISSPNYTKQINAFVNRMKLYIEMINLQLELIRYRKKCSLYSCLLLRSNVFNAILPTERISGSFKFKPLRLCFWQS